jgi:hypothetical protein
MKREIYEDILKEFPWDESTPPEKWYHEDDVIKAMQKAVQVFQNKTTEPLIQTKPKKTWTQGLIDGLIDAWRPLFELYPTLTAIPVFSWGRYYKYELAGEPFSRFVDENGFIQFISDNIKYKGFDEDLLEEIDDAHNVPDGKIWTGEIGDYFVDRDVAVKTYGFDSRGGNCLVIEKIDGELQVNVYDCDSPE